MPERNRATKHRTIKSDALVHPVAGLNVDNNIGMRTSCVCVAVPNDTVSPLLALFALLLLVLLGVGLGGNPIVVVYGCKMSLLVLPMISLVINPPPKPPLPLNSIFPLGNG